MSPAKASISSTVLIVEDDPQLLAFLGTAVRSSGFETAEASSGEEALKIIESVAIDLVVCDLRLPGMSGIDLVRELRQRTETSTLPFLLITGSGDEDSVIAGLDAGADDFLAKPVRLDELIARVRAHLRTRAAWTQVIETELRARADAVQALGQLTFSSLPEEAAEAVVGELARRTGCHFVGVLQLSGGARLRPLARFNPKDGLQRGGAPLAPSRTRYLLTRVREGPWSERVTGPEPDELSDPFWSAELDIAAGAPIYAGTELVGMLTIGVALGDELPGLAVRQSKLLASVIDYASVLSAVAGVAIADRRHAAEERRRLWRLIVNRAFHPVYQPIVELASRTPVGYEALTRFADGTPPAIRFAEAAAVGLSHDYELAAIEAALTGSQSLPEGLYLSLNVSPDLVLHSGRRLATLLGTTNRRIVLEVTEHAQIAEYKAFRRAVRRLGQVDVAVDDAGAGYASLRHILELRPAFAKLDITLVRRIDRDPLRQSLAAGLQYFALRTDCRLIAEGVEHEAEAEVLARLGVEFAQGYLFGRPRPT